MIMVMVIMVMIMHGNDDNGNDEKWIIVWLHYKVSKN